MATPHSLSLAHLCRICGEILSKRFFKVKEHYQRLVAAYLVDFSSDNPEIHPPHICHRCYSTMTNIELRQTTTQIKAMQWYHHTEGNCTTCNNKYKLCKGGRKPKKQKSGRPKEETWSREKIKLILETTPEDIVPAEYNIATFPETLNPHLKLCTCSLCQNILRKPVLLTACQHCFCANCILRSIEGKSMTQTLCPICNMLILQNTIIPSTYINNIIQSLQVPCKYNCGQNFKIINIKEKDPHECVCHIKCFTKIKKITLDEIFAINDNSEITQDIEDATLHVLRQKMNKSTLPNKSIEFKSGGPRVRILLNKYSAN